LYSYLLTIHSIRLVGTLIAGALVVHPSPDHLEVLFEQYGIPAIPNLDLTRLETEWLRFRSSIPEPWKLNNDGREYKVGEAAAARGMSAKYPTILVPGIVSTVTMAILVENGF
jgi:phospholipid:diacylglycerol acyltransferase